MRLVAFDLESTGCVGVGFVSLDLQAKAHRSIAVPRKSNEQCDFYSWSAISAKTAPTPPPASTTPVHSDSPSPDAPRGPISESSFSSRVKYAAVEGTRNYEWYIPKPKSVRNAFSARLPNTPQTHAPNTWGPFHCEAQDHNLDPTHPQPLLAPNVLYYTRLYMLHLTVVSILYFAVAFCTFTVLCRAMLCDYTVCCSEMLFFSVAPLSLNLNPKP